MPTKVLVCIAVFFALHIAKVHADMQPKENNLDGMALFGELSKEEASKKAREMAEHDFAKNVYRIFVVGRRPLENAYDDYLKEHYGVRVTPIAGCVVSDGIIGAEQNYNSTMKPLLNRKFGRDIFKEAEEATRR